jgi:hypothetical protein
MKSILKYLIILPILLISFSCDETATGDSSTGAIVGTWQLTALSGTYIRDVAVPSGTDATTTYNVTYTWPHAETVLGSASAADKTVKTYGHRANVLTATADAADSIATGAVQLVGQFKNDDTYTFVGTYPALRLIDPPVCTTYKTIADIDDDGSYNITYNADLTAGTLSITPLPGTVQVLPSFSDGVVTFTNDTTMNIVFLDRDGHDSLIVDIGETWVEADNRVTHGISHVYVDATNGYFTTDDTQPLNNLGYLYDPLGADGSPGTGDELLATWGYYYTYNAVMMGGCLAAGSDAATCAGAGYATDDSGHPFDLAEATAGGKLSMQVVPVCIPVNETIEFNATFAKQ